MNILGRLALFFIVVPLLELILLIQVGQVVGLGATILLVVFTGLVGAWLARAEGVRVFFQFQQEVAAGRLPAQSLQDGLAVLVGGALLLTPGILTDFVGFSLLLPASRRWIQKRVRARLERGIRDGSVSFVVMTPGSFGAGGFGGAGQAGRPGGSDPYDGRDPSKGIEVGRRDAEGE